jgi:phosphatidate phosphatase APP1
MKMEKLEREIANLVQRVEIPFDRLKYRIRTGDSPYIIIPYLGFGSQDFVKLKGRVVEDKGIMPAKESDRFWHNLINMYRRFESDEVPFAKVLVRFQGNEKEVVANEEGFFGVRLDASSGTRLNEGWQEAHFELLEPINPQAGKVQAIGQALIVSQNADFGVISDIDDTVVHTGVTSRLRLAYTILFKNARTRLPLEGVAKYYRALQAGSKREVANPLFYVSSSPWNMYGLFREFFQLNGIPAGPIFLRDWGFEKGSMFAVSNREFKLNAIGDILNAFPEMRFILIGDSGEKDPEIYAEVIRSHPQRILAAYIRSVRRDERRFGEIRSLAARVEIMGSAMILAEDTRGMSEHAAEQGWISSAPAF